MFYQSKWCYVHKCKALKTTLLLVYWMVVLLFAFMYLFLLLFICFRELGFLHCLLPSHGKMCFTWLISFSMNVILFETLLCAQLILFLCYDYQQKDDSSEVRSASVMYKGIARWLSRLSGIMGLWLVWEKVIFVALHHLSLVNKTPTCCHQM